MKKLPTKVREDVPSAEPIVASIVPAPGDPPCDPGYPFVGGCLAACAPAAACASATIDVLTYTHRSWIVEYFGSLCGSEMDYLRLGGVARAFADCFGTIGMPVKSETFRLVRSAAAERQRVLAARIDPCPPEVCEDANDAAAGFLTEGSDDDYSDFPDFFFDHGPG